MPEMNLRTSRLVLRDFVDSDVDALLAYESDPRYLRFYPWETRTREGVATLVNRFIQWQNEQPRTRFQFAMVPRKRRDAIGTCGIRITSVDHREAEFWCVLNPECWGQGFAAEAGRALIEYGFTAISLHRIWSECIAENIAARRLVERLGMREEGVLRARTWIKERWWDTVIYAILSDEWK